MVLATLLIDAEFRKFNRKLRNLSVQYEEDVPEYSGNLKIGTRSSCGSAPVIKLGR
jgi:hypothetical protein